MWFETTELDFFEEVAPIKKKNSNKRKNKISN